MTTSLQEAISERRRKSLKIVRKILQSGIAEKKAILLGSNQNLYISVVPDEVLKYQKTSQNNDVISLKEKLTHEKTRRDSDEIKKKESRAVTMKDQLNALRSSYESELQKKEEQIKKIKFETLDIVQNLEK